jgi:hypothetical protein
MYSHCWFDERECQKRQTGQFLRIKEAGNQCWKLELDEYIGKVVGIVSYEID